MAHCYHEGMHLFGSIFKDERISRHLVQLGIVLVVLVFAIVGAVAVGWHLQSNRNVPDTSLSSTTTPIELTFEEKMRTLNAMSGTSTGSGSAATTSASSSIQMPGTNDTVAPANDPRTKTLDALAARHAAVGSGSGTASSSSNGSASSSSGLSAEEKMKLLNSIQK